MTISIIGLGWLGLPLASHLLNNGYKVKGTTTTSSKRMSLLESNLEVYEYKLGQNVPESLIISDYIIIAVPPRGSNYKENLMSLVSQINKNTNIIFVSSTSVYPDANKIMTENDAIDIISPHTGISMYQCENIFKDVGATIIRFAGLFGPERHPGYFFANKKVVPGGNNPVNMIHLDDCIGLITTIISKRIINEVFNGCADEHPTKQNFYTIAAKSIGLNPPDFISEATSYKIIDNSKSKVLLNYNYKYPDIIMALDLI